MEEKATTEMNLYKICYSSGHNDADVGLKRELYIASESESKAIESWDRWSSVDSQPYRFISMDKITSTILVIE